MGIRRSGGRIVRASCLSLRPPVAPPQMQVISKENSHNLHALPPELLLEIMSHLDSPVALVDYSHFDPRCPRFQVRRREALIALSETCRTLRQFFSPFVWERIEVRSGLKIRKPPTVLQGGSHETKKMREFSGEILRQLKVATVIDPTLSQHVR